MPAAAATRGPSLTSPAASSPTLPGDLSDRDATLRFMMPPPEQFAAAMSGYGVGEGVRAILYDRAAGMWAARIWWMLRAFGYDNAALLNGGWTKWTAEGRPHLGRRTGTADRPASRPGPAPS